MMGDGLVVDLEMATAAHDDGSTEVGAWKHNLCTFMPSITQRFCL